jgi:hypothetical protein
MFKKKVLALIMTNGGCSGEEIIFILFRGGGDPKMIMPIHFEVFSTGMKARLSPTYRREFQLNQQIGFPELLRNYDHVGQTTVLPFTTKTKAYGTYTWKKH